MSLYCHLPWTEIFINSKSVAPCCQSLDGNNGTINDYFESNFLKDIKQQMLNGITPKNCANCSKNELEIGHSLRITQNSSRPDLLDAITKNSKYDHIENVLLLTGNICNLKCLPCSGASYTRLVELKKLNLTNSIPILSEEKYNVNDFIKFKFKKLTLIGGEPFYDKSAIKLLYDLAGTGKSSEIELDINTNCTSIQQETIDFLSKNYKFITIKASIDGIGPVNEYLRYPSKWTVITDTIKMLKKYNNVSVLVTTALSNLSFVKYYQVIEWCVQSNIKDVFLTPVTDVEELRLTNLPAKLKLSLTHKYETIKLRYNNLSNHTIACIDTAIGICNNNIEYDMSPTFNWLQKHDDLRKTNWSVVFPELIEYVKI